MLKSNRLKSIKEIIIKPKYIICDVFPDNCDPQSYMPYVELKKVPDIGYKPDEIFILAPSLKTANCPARLLENYLKLNDQQIPIFVPSYDDVKLDESIINNKLIFSTFHQAKGLERKIVMIYVVITRAKERLILLHRDKQNYLPFIAIEKLQEYADIDGELGKLDQYKIMNELDTQVTSMI